MNIAIITGGVSGERDVSLASSKNVAKVVGFAQTKTFVFPENLDEFIQSYKQFDLVIPMIHGKGGEDGSLQGLLEHLNLPYLFSGTQSHSIAIDKKRTKQIASQLGITVTQESSSDGFPFFAKPRFGGSSVNSGLCKNVDDLNRLLSYNEELILEKPVIGREFTVGVVDVKGETTPLPVIEIITPKGEFFGYDQKYNPDKLAQEICPAQIQVDLAEELQKAALTVHVELGVKHMSRSDFIVDAQGKVWFLEINTIPGMTGTSLIPKMLKTAGIDVVELFKDWCEQLLKK